MLYIAINITCSSLKLQVMKLRIKEEWYRFNSILHLLFKRDLIFSIKFSPEMSGIYLYKNTRILRINEYLLINR